MNRTCLLIICLALRLQCGAEEYNVYFGTYTGGNSKGIYVSRFNTTTGKLSEPELAVETTNPSFLAVHPNGRFIYAAGEVAGGPGGKGGVVSAFSINKESGKLTALNQQSSRGSGPCYVALDATGKCALVANYGSGSIAAMPVHEDGTLGEPVTAIQHTGSGTNPQRQAGPHAHMISTSPDNRFALVADLGLDKVLAYRLDADKALLTTNDPPFAALGHGAGPRHFAFSKDGKFVHVINEMALSITTFAYEPKTAVMIEVQTTPTVPPGYKVTDKDSCAEICVHPNGKFVYGSNRGHDSIAVFSADTKTGLLTLRQNEPTQGKTPRHFAIDPSGHWLFAENQNSGSVVVLSVDEKTGLLKPAGQTLAVGSPVCAVFVKAK